MRWFDTSIYVKDDLPHVFPIPSSTNQLQTLEIICIKQELCMFSKLGQANSEFKVQEWKQQQPNDNLFFHGCRGKLADV